MADVAKDPAKTIQAAAESMKAAASTWLTPLEPVLGKVEQAGIGILFHFAVALVVIFFIVTWSMRLSKTLNAPTPPTGAIGRSYDALVTSRKSLSSYLADKSIPDTTPMVQFQIATAGFGGIFTEPIGYLDPWIGVVSPDAARLQVEAGARAIVFDIWPDPAAPTNPVVCAMLDTNEWGIQNWWRNRWGLNKGVGRYSNWQLLTRNKVDAGIMMSTACEAAFATTNSQQNNDPFFMILRLHGAMTPAYLDKLGGMVQRALGGHAMGPNYSNWKQQKQLCSTPVSEFLAKGSDAGGYGFVIVCPDMSPGYNILPGVNTYAKFVASLANSQLAQVTNAVEADLNTLWFDPSMIGPVSQANQPNCVQGNVTPLTLAEAGFCVIQPSVGGQTTENPVLFRDNSLQTCQQSGAQMVAVNLFSPDPDDGVLQNWFSPNNFGTYSFKKGT